ncbi:hypothetical protein [Psychrobacter sp. L7]|uniref:hypothetical protein n=1 Tax=Psychrobacter sp. L7 TaxID=1982756 RepID=UPI00128FED2F|nr:hypothetical protein [Psychrobacter sp. L7]
MSWKNRADYLKGIRSYKNFFVDHKLLEDSCTDKYLLKQALNYNEGFEKLVNIRKMFKVQENGKDLPVIVIFQGFVEKYVKNALNDDFDLKKLNNSELGFCFGSFARQHDDFNYIFVKDNFQLWYLMGFPLILNALYVHLQKLNAEKVYTIGFSAGGFASILFGHYLRADLAFSYYPQTLAFSAFTNNYRNLMNFKFNLSMLSISDLALVQKVSGGFACKTIVSYCEGSAVDINQIERLNLEDGNLIIRKYPCNTHNLFGHLNSSDEFDKIKSTIVQDLQGIK